MSQIRSRWGISITGIYSLSARSWHIPAIDDGTDAATERGI
jgi:hypothetical protein